MRIGSLAVLALVFFMCWGLQARELSQNSISGNDDIDNFWQKTKNVTTVKKLFCGTKTRHFAVESAPFFFRFSDDTRHTTYVLLETHFAYQDRSVETHRKLVLESMESDDRIEVVISESEGVAPVVSSFISGQYFELPCEELVYRDKGMPRPLNDYL